MIPSSESILLRRSTPFIGVNARNRRFLVLNGRSVTRPVNTPNFSGLGVEGATPVFLVAFSGSFVYQTPKVGR